MRLIGRPILIILLTIGLFVVGLLFLIRGCLSKYDERSAIPQSLYFEKDSKAVIFSLVKFEKTTSYQQDGGFINKSVNTSYFIQNNDAVTATKLADKKIREHREIKNHPVEILGAANGQAWVFMGELMAFDPFTLEKKADLEMIQEKNPQLKDRFPSERKFYVFDRADGSIHLTAADGSRWKLNTATLIASAEDEPLDNDGESKGVALLKKQMKQNQAQQDSLMENKLRKPSRMLSAKEISMQQYRKLMEGFNEERSALYKVRDSLQHQLSKSQQEERSGEDIHRKIESLRGKTGISFSQVKTNMDTINGKWYGLYTMPELEKLWERVQNQPAYGETARRQLYVTGYSSDRNGDFVFDKEHASAINSSSFFLDGGFLLNKNTGNPVKLSSSSFLIVHKDIIGNEGKVQVSRVDTDGKIAWTFNTGLKEWADWILTDKQFFVFGTNNKKLSSGEVSIFWSIDLSTGKAMTYDYFTDK
jgi:hypothetical protein